MVPTGVIFIVSRSFFFQAEDGIRDHCVTGVQTCALPISLIDYLEAGDPLEAFLADFPSVSREHAVAVLELAKSALLARSEERRVGKECRCRWSPYHGKQRSAEVEKVRFVG